MRFASLRSILPLFIAAIASLVSCKELVLTKEWQIVHENETLPAGAHIRMDLTTGEKMAKLVDEQHDSKEQAIAVSSSGEIHIEDSKSDGTIDSGESMQEKIREARANYDYDMMFRTLSKLPIEEQERMGLPHLPSSTSNSEISTEERNAFQEKMKLIWERRQEELARLQLEMQMDMPELLKDRIARIKAYLNDPSKHLAELREKSAMTNQDVDEGIVTDIESVLVDLEYHLADLDMTRDFHTLGGWHILVSLLDDSVHQLNTNETNVDLVNRVKMHAAWAVGTALKNTEEFYPYAIEIVFVHGKQTTPLLLVKEQLDKCECKKARQKLIYALGAMLRGNREAQVYFLRIGGPTSLSQYLYDTLRNDEDFAVVKRILALTGDVVSDIVLHDHGYENIILSLTSPQLCQTVLESLKHRALRETSVRTIQIISRYCDWQKEEAANALKKVQKAWEEETELDPQIRSELLDLVSHTLVLLGTN